MAEPSDNPCSTSSKDNQYSDPLEVAASAGAKLSTAEKASFSRERIRFLWFGLRETQSYNIDESVWYLTIIPWARVGYNQSHIQQSRME